MSDLPSVGPDRCGAPGGLLGAVCTGPSGHPGYHGADEDRWSDEQAIAWATARDDDSTPLEDASGPLSVFRGAVHTQARATYRGVVTLLDGWVHVELVQPGDVSAVMVPVHEVGAIDVATEQTG